MGVPATLWARQGRWEVGLGCSKMQCHLQPPRSLEMEMGLLWGGVWGWMGQGWRRTGQTQTPKGLPSLCLNILATPLPIQQQPQGGGRDQDVVVTLTWLSLAAIPP